MRRTRAALALAVAVALGGYRMATESATVALAVAAIPVPLDPTDPAHDRVGRLRYLGGLELRSPERRFGGISGMRFLADGRLLAVTDEGSWVTLTPIETRGRLTAIAAATLAPMVDVTGRPLRDKADADAEALEIGPDGARYAAFEHRHRVWAYDAAGAHPRAHNFPDAAWLASLPSNSGLEAIARVGAHWLYLAEDAPAGGFNGIVEGEGAIAHTYGRVRYQPPADFKPTDAAALGPDTVLILNRHYSTLSGVAAALTVARIDGRTLALSPAAEIARIEAPLTVDNMEALAVRREGGRTFVYLASDDNFSPLQRTLLMKFELLP